MLTRVMRAEEELAGGQRCAHVGAGAAPVTAVARLERAGNSSSHGAPLFIRTYWTTWKQAPTLPAQRHGRSSLSAKRHTSHPPSTTPRPSKILCTLGTR